VKRILLLTPVFLLATAAVMLVGGSLAVLVRWEGWKFARYSTDATGGRTEWHVWVYLNSVGVAKFYRPPDPGRTSSEFGVVSMGHGLDEDHHFFLGQWSHDYRDAFYSPTANVSYDPYTDTPPALKTFRRAIEMDRKMLMLDTWWCVAVLSLLPAAVLLHRLRQYYLRRRERNQTHCRVCGYDLRATPGRCPECGMVPVRKVVPGRS